MIGSVDRLIACRLILHAQDAILAVGHRDGQRAKVAAKEYGSQRIYREWPSGKCAHDISGDGVYNRCIGVRRR